MSGWGGGKWGETPWGGSSVDSLQMLRALAVRDNVVRLWFNVAPKFIGNLELGDAADPERFVVVPIAGTKGADGLPARPVYPCAIERAAIAGSLGTVLDVTVDRPFSPWPAQYRISCNGVQSITGLFLDPTSTSRIFDGLSRGFAPARADLVVSAKDIANPQNRAAMLDPLPNTTDSLILGTIPTDAQGDLAFDDGVDSYRKRLFRRCLTRKGAFAHLPGYGVGLPDQVKRLALPGVRDALASDAEAQIRQEPETTDVSCVFVATDTPELFWLRVRATTTFGNTPVEFDVPFDATGG